MAQTNVLFREIHKNAWLRKLPTVDKKIGAHPKKGDRVWTVFCVHNDSEPLLELYNDQKQAGAHKPDAIVPLSNVLHISPTICATEDEFEFVVTLPSEVFRFTAPTWDQMTEWVDSICCKLREMKILSPKENVYSRMPEQRPPLLPTRDPNSPLPLPPVGPSSFVPGVEPVLPPDSSGESSAVVGTSANASRQETPTTSNGVPETTSSHISASLYTRALQRLCTSSSVLSHSASPVSPRRGSPRPPVPLPSPGSAPTPSPVTSTSHNSTNNNNSNTVAPSDSNCHNSSSNENNITVIEVSSSNSQPSNSGVFDFSFVNESLSINDENEEFFTPPATPVLPRSVARFIGNTPLSNISSNIGLIKRNHSFNAPNQDVHQTSSNVNVNSAEPLVLFDSHRDNVNNVSVNPIISANPVSCVSSKMSSPVIPISSPVSSSSATPSIPAGAQVHSSTSQSESGPPNQSENEPIDSNVYEHIFPSGNPSSPPPVSGNLSPGISESLATPIVANQIQNIHGPVSRGRGNPRSRRRGSHAELASPVAADRIRIIPSQRLQPAPRPSRQSANPEPSGQSRLTLREQQVIQLRREIMHPGGVRLQVRRKDCLGPIAFVDAFGAVWIAGWKQKEHPMLYNVLHIGDQIVSITGIQIHNAADALKVIKGAQSLYIEFVIRRVPCGRVFALRREREGQSLGIVQENGTAEIREVVPNSLAAMQGLTSRTPTMDGLSLSSWVLTEINGRPLNLFFKDGEVKDRLNAVGLDISILVQPFDLIKQIKKQLKTLRSYKDFIVQ